MAWGERPLVPRHPLSINAHKAKRPPKRTFFIDLAQNPQAVAAPPSPRPVRIYSATVSATPAADAIAANRYTELNPNSPATYPASGPVTPSDKSRNTEYADNAAPRLAGGTSPTASTPSAGKISAKPNPVSAAPASAKAGSAASQSISKPTHSNANDTIATRKPPNTLMVFANKSREPTNIVPNTVSESAASGQLCAA